MNIGFDAKRAFSNNTGLGNYSRFIINGLVNSYTNNKYALYTQGADSHPELNAVLKIPGVNVINLGNGLSGKIKRVSGFKTEELDLFHGLSNELPLSLSNATKKIVSIHDLLFLRYPDFYPFIDRTIYKWKVIKACRNADLIIAISEQTKSDLIYFFNIPETKIVVHYQSCHPQFTFKRTEQEIKNTFLKYGLARPYILQVGTLENRKNALLTIKAFNISRLKESHQLVLVGKRTTYCNYLEQYVRSNNLTEKVKFIFNAAFPDFPALYQGASVLVYPSLFEGFGIPILEGMISGVPVITTKGGCFEEVGNDAVVYIDPLQEYEFATKLELVLSDKGLSEQLIVKGKQRAHFFSEQKLITHLMNIYTQLQ